jgi:hypothetical protein
MTHDMRTAESGITRDAVGFWRRYCTVVEAKGNYDWMFPEAPKPPLFFADATLRDWRDSCEAQLLAISTAQPRARIEWHFLQERSWLKALNDAGIAANIAKHTPF